MTEVGQVREPEPTNSKTSGTGKGTWVVLVVCAVLLFVAVFTVLSLFDGSTDSNDKLTADMEAQREYETRQQVREERKADRLKDAPLVVKETDPDNTADVFRELERKREARIREIREQQEADGNQAALLDALLKPKANPTPVEVRTVERTTPSVSREIYRLGEEENPQSRRVSMEAQERNRELETQPMFAYSRRTSAARVFDEPETASGTSHEARPVMERSAASSSEPVDTINSVLYTRHQPVTVFEGEFIECVLLNKIVSDTEESPVVVAVSRDVIDNSGKWVVIPANSRIIGKSSKVTYMGASRMFISFERMILPGGESVRFPYNKRALKALDETGAQGVVSDVNRHWMLQFGAALFVGVLDGLGAAAQNHVDPYSSRAYMVDETTQNFDKILNVIMQRYTNIVPTITVWQGETMKVFLSGDVLISPYCAVGERSYAKVLD